VSTLQSQQLIQHQIARDQLGDLPVSPKQQPSSFPLSRSRGIKARVAAIVLAALALSLILAYAAVSAVSIQNGYTAMALRRETEDLRAHNLLLQHQIDVTRSNQRLREAAARLGLHSADPVGEADYIVVSDLAVAAGAQTAQAGESRPEGGLAARLDRLAMAVVGSADGRAEASTE